MITGLTRLRCWLGALALLFVNAPVWSQTDVAALERRIQAMEQELQQMRGELETARITTEQAQLEASEWKQTTSAFHLAGYASVGYTDQENGTGSFDVANFNPIFHFQYSDLVMWEAEVELAVDEQGNTELGLEYTTIDLFLTDNLVLVGGKFLSPLGQFRQNLHPSWINKLPAAPPGFGHDGAAPLSDLGLQLRGGNRLGARSRLNYAVYVSNGPQLEAEEGEIHAVEAEGFASDPDDEKVWGGRVGFLPMPGLEIGVSAAFGDVAIVEEEGIEIEDEPTRDYDVFGADFVYHIGNAELRGEYIEQEVGEASASIAPERAKWETWYGQAAYRLGRSPWEGVLRYTDFDSAHGDEDQEQWAIGINYLLAPQAMAKFAYEFNDGEPGEHTDANRWLVQLSYGY